MPGTRLGVDVGGTFTDVVTVRDGRVAVEKTPSTPDAPEEGVLDGLAAAFEAGTDPGDVSFLGHGTTVATNAVLEREWADTALVTTEGFRDALEIGRQDRPDLYDLDASKPDPVVPRDRRFEVPERLGERGAVLEPLEEAAVRDLAAGLERAEAVAVCLLFAFEDDAHERRIRDVLRDAGVDVPVSLSSEVHPEIREYERTLVTALNAALRPVMDRYVGALQSRIGDRDVPADFRLMGSNGGLMTAGVARERPVRTLLSGPAAGVRGAAHVAALAGDDDAITMDMGGTSCDVSLVRDGDPVTSTEVTVGDYPVAVPMIDVHTIGAGGGSVGWIDEGGALRVGPRSAGADPGPICYGRGGTEPTVTDAHFLLGRLDPERFGHGFDVDSDAVREGFEDLADALDTDAEGAARGLLEVANADMERALRVVSVERGHDPRSFALVAFGGAGPLHAARLAAALSASRVLVPRTAGVLSALGLLVSDAVYAFSESRVRPWAAADHDAVVEAFERFEAEGRERLADAGFAPPERRFERALDLRYAGQSYELTVDVAAGDDPAGIAERFHRAHERRYGHASPDEPLELVTVRLRARGVVDPPALSPPEEGSAEDARRGERRAVLGGEPRGAQVYDRGRLPAGAAIEGPAVIEGAGTTVLLHPGQDARVDDRGTLVVEVT